MSSDWSYSPEQLTRGASWMRPGAPESDVVVSSRVRLARNVRGHRFVARADEGELDALLDELREQVGRLRIDGSELQWIDLRECPALERTVLVERHLISRDHAKASHPRGAGVSMPDERISIMALEEDHLRLQSLRAGLDLSGAFEAIDAVDDQLETDADVRYAYSPRFGYLAACPTNVGTGIRVSVMVHLPGLALLGEIDKVRRATRDMSLAVRGFYGEGSEAAGDLYQISNQTTLGKSERVLVHEIEHEIIPRVLEYERAARRHMLAKRRRVAEDKAWRALGVLQNARLLTAEDAMSALSAVRFGASEGLIETVPVETINQLILQTQSAHLQRIVGREMNQAERREARADLVRERLSRT